MLFLFQPGHLAVELAGARRPDGHSAAISFVELLDLLAKLLALGQKLDNLARPAVAVENAVPRSFQFAHHFDERNAIQARAEIVEQFGRVGVAQRAEFLHFAQARRRRCC